MRLYGKRIIRNTMRRETERRIETRDAILWDVLPDQRLCRVKISGTDKLIAAYYPENWEKTPFWLKPGNAVRVAHTSGVRGKIEIVGHGQLVPAEAGFPSVPSGQDAILEGCFVVQPPNAPNCGVILATVGTYRISGTEYELEAIRMSAGTVLRLGMGGALGNIAAAKTIAADPPENNFRYDILVVGADGAVDYIQGTNFTDTPVMPSVPGGHLLLNNGILFLVGPVGSGPDPPPPTPIPPDPPPTPPDPIPPPDPRPVPTSIRFVIGDKELEWTEYATTVRLEVLDNYGRLMLPYNLFVPWYFTLEITSGNGTIFSTEEGPAAGEGAKIGGHSALDQAGFTFTYTRDALPGDHSPYFTGTLEINNPLSAQDQIILLDDAGDPMP